MSKKPHSLQDILKRRQQEEFVGREEQLIFFRRNLRFHSEAFYQKHSVSEYPANKRIDMRSWSFVYSFHHSLTVCCPSKVSTYSEPSRDLFVFSPRAWGWTGI